MTTVLLNTVIFTLNVDKPIQLLTNVLQQEYRRIFTPRCMDDLIHSKKLEQPIIQQLADHYECDVCMLLSTLLNIIFHYLAVECMPLTVLSHPLCVLCNILLFFVYVSSVRILLFLKYTMYPFHVRALHKANISVQKTHRS